MFLNRRQRREMLRQRGILRIISKMNFFSETKTKIRESNREEGRKMQQARADQYDKLNSERLEAILESAKQSWIAFGYIDSEIAMLEEAWALMAVKTKETYREDKKRARQLNRDAQASLNSRLNG